MNRKVQEVFFIAVGRLEHQKGYDLLIEIFRRFKNSVEGDHKVYIVGDGSQKTKIKDLIQKNNLTNDIILTGATNNVKQYYAASKVFLLTSRWEGMPVVIDEAFSLGLPVIAFDCETGPREMIDDGINGFLIPMNDIEGFVKKMILLAQEDLTLSQLSLNCSTSIAKKADPVILEKWQNLFKQL